jgi:hypothetical protein
MVFDGQSPDQPVSSPEGRFHHGGQPALYASLTPQGTAVAIKRYMRPDDPPRVIYPLDLTLDRVADHRGDLRLSAVWQDIRETGALSPTWVFSDVARAEGAQALLYSSRSRPDLAHLVLFDIGPDTLRAVGKPVSPASF